METKWSQASIEEKRHFAAHGKGNLWHKSRKIYARVLLKCVCNFCRRTSPGVEAAGSHVMGKCAQGIRH